MRKNILSVAEWYRRKWLQFCVMYLHIHHWDEIADFKSIFVRCKFASKKKLKIENCSCHQWYQKPFWQRTNWFHLRNLLIFLPFDWKQMVFIRNALKILNVNSPSWLRVIFTPYFPLQRFFAPFYSLFLLEYFFLYPKTFFPSLATSHRETANLI